MSPWQILELSDSESKKTSIISQNHLSGFLSKKILYIVCGDATLHQSFIPFHAWHCHRELIRMRNHPHRRQRGAWSGFYTVFFVLLYFDGSFSFCQSQRWHHPSRAQRTCTCLQPHLVAPRMIICLKTVPSVVFFARAGFRSLRWSLSTLSGSCPSPNSKTQRNFLGLIQPVASGNWAPQLCKAISAARTVREQCFLEARPGWEDKMVLCWGKWNIANPGQAQRHIASLSILVLWLRRP